MPFGGETSVGAAGGLPLAVVVKLHTVAQSLVPPAFDALTRQKCCVLPASPVTLADVPATVWSRITDVKPASVATCTRYDVAVADAFQVKVGLVETPVAPL